MKTFTNYEIIDHGIENSQYFQGCGTTYTDFGYVVTGIGGNSYDAIDNCLDQIENVCNISTLQCENLKKQIEFIEVGPKIVTIVDQIKNKYPENIVYAIENNDNTKLSIDEINTCHQILDEYEEIEEYNDVLYYHISIRFNCSYSIQRFEYDMPTHFLSALINGDESGLENEDLAILNEVYEEITKLNETYGTTGYWDRSDRDPEFNHNPDFCNLACDTIKTEYVLINCKNAIHYSNLYLLELNMRIEDIDNMSHQGDCYKDCKRLLPYYLPQLEKMDFSKIVYELKQAGAWTTKELIENKEETYMKYLWLAANDLKEG